MADERSSKPGPKRSRDQRERDLATIAEHYLKGKTQWQIAEIIGVSREQIRHDLKELRKRWRKQYSKATDKLMEQELAKLDRLEETYWAAWERSLSAKKRTRRTVDAVKGVVVSAETAEEESYGDARFLQGVYQCIQKRAQILGIDLLAEKKQLAQAQDDMQTMAERIRETVLAMDEVTAGNETPDA